MDWYVVSLDVIQLLGDAALHGIIAYSNKTNTNEHRPSGNKSLSFVILWLCRRWMSFELKNTSSGGPVSSVTAESAQPHKNRKVRGRGLKYLRLPEDLTLLKISPWSVAHTYTCACIPCYSISHLILVFHEFGSQLRIIFNTISWTEAGVEQHKSWRLELHLLFQCTHDLKEYFT